MSIVFGRIPFFIGLISLFFFLNLHAMRGQDLNNSIATYDFGQVSTGNIGVLYVVLSNPGPGANIQVSNIALGGADPTEFNIDAALPLDIAPGEEVGFFIEYIPTLLVAVAAQVTVVHNGDNADIDIDLDAEGCPAVIPGAGDIYLPTADGIEIEVESQPASDDWDLVSAVVLGNPTDFYQWTGGTLLHPALAALETKFVILWASESICIVNFTCLNPCFSRRLISRSKMASQFLFRAKLSSVRKKSLIPFDILERIIFSTSSGLR